MSTNKEPDFIKIGDRIIHLRNVASFTAADTVRGVVKVVLVRYIGGAYDRIEGDDAGLLWGWLTFWFQEDDRMRIILPGSFPD